MSSGDLIDCIEHLTDEQVLQASAFVGRRLLVDTVGPDRSADAVERLGNVVKIISGDRASASPTPFSAHIEAARERLIVLASTEHWRETVRVGVRTVSSSSRAESFGWADDTRKLVLAVSYSICLTMLVSKIGLELPLPGGGELTVSPGVPENYLPIVNVLGEILGVSGNRHLPPSINAPSRVSMHPQ